MAIMGTFRSINSVAILLYTEPTALLLELFPVIVFKLMKNYGNSFKSHGLNKWNFMKCYCYMEFYCFSGNNYYLNHQEYYSFIEANSKWQSLISPPVLNHQLKSIRRLSPLIQVCMYVCVHTEDLVKAKQSQMGPQLFYL